MRKITARSYSCTTLKQKKSDIGMVMTIKIIEHIMAKISMHPTVLPSAGRE
jgi:hypothetical protein